MPDVNLQADLLLSAHEKENSAVRQMAKTRATDKTEGGNAGMFYVSFD